MLIHQTAQSLIQTFQEPALKSYKHKLSTSDLLQYFGWTLLESAFYLADIDKRHLTTLKYGFRYKLLQLHRKISLLGFQPFLNPKAKWNY
jgi:hypothetical protein